MDKHAELLERVEELEAWKEEWSPILIMALQSLAALVNGPMAQMFPIPPQARALIKKLESSN